MQKARETAAPAAAAEPRSFDGFVVAAITVVALALGLAAYLQLGLGGGAAAASAIVAHVAMTCAHIAIRRGHRITELAADVERMRQGDLAPPARPRPAAVAGKRQAPAGHRPGPLTGRAPEPRGTAPRLPERDRSTIGNGRFEQLPPVAVPTAPYAATAVVAQPGGGVAERGEASATAPMQVAPPAPPPSLEVAVAAPARSDAPDAPLDPRSAVISQMWTLRPGSVRERIVAGGPLLTALPEVVVPPAPQPFAAGPVGRFAGRPDLGPPPVSTMMQSPEPLSGPALEMALPPAPDGVDVPPPAGATYQPEPRLQGPRESADELATIQALIKRLADDLSAPRKPEPPELAASDVAFEMDGAAGPQDALISRSVEALRETADLMRQAAPAALRSEPPAAGRETVPVAAPAPARDMLAVAAPAQTEGGMVDPAFHGGTADEAPSTVAIAEAVADERFSVYVEPIHGLPDGKARHFEVSVRLDLGEGRELDPRELSPEQCDRALLTRIDGAKFLRTARFAARLLMKGKRASVHSTVAATSLAEDAFIDGVADGIGADERLATHLVLSFTQGDVRTFSPVHWEALRTLAAIGVRFAIEDVVDVDMDLEALKAEGFDFVKLDADVLVRGMPAGTATIPPPDICRYLAQIGMSIVVGGIDDDLTRAQIMGFGVVLGRGALFGGARQVQVDVDGRSRMAAA